MEKNVATAERLVSVGLGALALAAAYRFRKHPQMAYAGATAGISLIARGATGRCPAYHGLSLDSGKIADKVQAKVDSLLKPGEFNTSVVFDKPIAAVEAFLAGKSFAGIEFKKGEQSHQFTSQVEGSSWQLELAKAARGKHTRLRVTAASPSKLGTLTSFGSHNQRRFADKALRELKAIVEAGKEMGKDIADSVSDQVAHVH